MKRLIALILICTLLFTGCSPQVNNSNSTPTSDSKTESQQSSKAIVSEVSEDKIPEFKSLNDTKLLTYLEDTVYSNLKTELNSDEYSIESVNTKYVSKGYLEELEYNSQENIYFGYKLSDLNEVFQGKKYIFTLGNNGQTAVAEFKEYDNTYDKVLKGVLIGTGVILITVTVCVISKNLAAPTAVSMIFATSAKKISSITSSVPKLVKKLAPSILSAAAKGVVTGIDEKDFNEGLKETLKSAALDGIEDLRLSAMFGTAKKDLKKSD